MESEHRGSPSRGRPTRLHVGGKLAFRRRVPSADAASGALPLVELSDDPPELATLVPSQFERVEIEVGPGKGTFMVAATEARPDVFLLGIEAAPSYARYSAERLAKAGRDNAVVLVDNAKLYLRDRVADGALDRLHVYFSDPWPKRRHRKRRFFSADMCATYARVLRAGGHLLCATDNAAYAGEICGVLGSCAALVRDEDEERRLSNLPPGHAFGPTNFERKYAAEHRIIRRYAYCRRA